MIYNLLEKTKNPDASQARDVLEKAKEKKGLLLDETAILLNSGEEVRDELFETAGQVKHEIYGNRVVMFAPLYVSNLCVNNCAYCGFGAGVGTTRKKLSMEEIAQQTKKIINMGHKRILLEAGEHPEANFDFILDAIKTIYDTKGKGEIRRLNVNVAPLSVEEFKRLKEAGIGTYQLFQETYHRETYERLHKGPKADFERQYHAHDKALEAGIDDYGMGVLFGLYDFKYEVLSLINHAGVLELNYGVGPHTLSVPRWKPAQGVGWDHAPHKVRDEDFLKIIAVLRLAVPYTGMIISTRESPEIRAQAFRLGVSQASAGSKTSPGGYGSAYEAEQFSLSDQRSLEEVVDSLVDSGFMPSWCTACYRKGRTGEVFMDLAKPGKIHTFCDINAILSFAEYLEDYAGEELKEKGYAQIRKIAKGKGVLRRLKDIKNGARDLFF